MISGAYSYLGLLLVLTDFMLVKADPMFAIKYARGASIKVISLVIVDASIEEAPSKSVARELAKLESSIVRLMTETAAANAAVLSPEDLRKSADALALPVELSSCSAGTTGSKLLFDALGVGNGGVSSLNPDL